MVRRAQPVMSRRRDRLAWCEDSGNLHHGAVHRGPQIVVLLGCSQCDRSAPYTVLVRARVEVDPALVCAEVTRVGSVRTRASQCRLKWDEANPGSCGLQDGQHGHTPPEVEESAAIGGNMLMGAGAEAEEVAQFIVSPAEPGG